MRLPRRIAIRLGSEMEILLEQWSVPRDRPASGTVRSLPPTMTAWTAQAMGPDARREADGDLLWLW